MKMIKEWKDFCKEFKNEWEATDFLVKALKCGTFDIDDWDDYLTVSYKGMNIVLNYEGAYLSSYNNIQKALTKKTKSANK